MWLFGSFVIRMNAHTRGESNIGMIQHCRLAGCCLFVWQWMMFEDWAWWPAVCSNDSSSASHTMVPEKMNDLCRSSIVRSWLLRWWWFQSQECPRPQDFPRFSPDPQVSPQIFDKTVVSCFHQGFSAVFIQAGFSRGGSGIISIFGQKHTVIKL